MGSDLKTAGVATNDYDPRLNTSLREWVAPYGGLLRDRPRRVRGQISWTPLAGAAPPGDRRDPLGGLVIEHDSPARRPYAEPPASGLAALKTLTQKQTAFDAQLSATVGGADWTNRTLQLTGGLDPETGARLLSELAAEYTRLGSARLSADTLYLLARRYPDHALTEHA